MKDQLLQELSVLHEKVAALKVYDRESALLLRQHARGFEALLTRLLMFDEWKFKDVAIAYRKTLPEGFHQDVDVHDDTDNDHGFYDSVENLNKGINDSIEIINGI